MCKKICSKNVQHKGSCYESSLAVAGESEPLVAVGTCQAFGEDYPATGRVLFFQITRKPGSGTEEEEEWDTQMIYARSTACCTCLSILKLLPQREQLTACQPLITPDLTGAALAESMLLITQLSKQSTRYMAYVPSILALQNCKP